MDNNKPHLIEEIMYFIIGIMVLGGAAFWILEGLLNAVGIPVNWK